MTGCRRLPEWGSVLAVVAHPDDESFGLGAVLATFAARGAAVSVLCFTRGEASTLHGVPGDLAAVRAAELEAAARALGVGDVTLLGYPDGGLDQVPVGELGAHVVAAAARTRAVGLVVFDPSGVTGHRDHRQATRAALDAAAGLGLPVLGWTLPAEVAAALNAEYDTAFAGHLASGIDLSVAVDRTRQFAAVRCHPSQAVPGSVLWRRLDLLGDTEHARWLHDQTTNRDRRVPGQRQPLPPVPQGPGRPETYASGRTTAARPIVEDAEHLP
jgi:LmbE family N-acetylglucosaminyl deacetylase